MQLGTSQPMGFAVQLLVEGFVALGLSFYYGWKLTLVILASLPVSALILHFISRGLQTHISCQSEALSHAAQIANNAISNISLIKYFNTQTETSRRYTGQIHRASTFYLKQARANALQIGFIKFATTTMFVQGQVNVPDTFKKLGLTAGDRLLVRVGPCSRRIHHCWQGHYDLLEQFDGSPGFSGCPAAYLGPCESSGGSICIEIHH